MCHWALRVWDCGDSFFTKYSSCSFDRAANNPNNPLNPLHPSITPFGRSNPSQVDDTSSPTVGPSYIGGNVREMIKPKRTWKPRAATKKQSRGRKPSLSRPALATTNDGAPKGARLTPGINSVETACSQDGRRRREISIMPLPEVGNASRFGDQMLGESKKCQVFEVVLQTRESTICPSCARSPRRAALPAHARGCFGLS
ncbi:hypothetical protein EJ07DRAFT_150530 [Lizonia empirigonia]|nr:hypothetical protein EJ07DRAFT_150530 [Lizonia empirigonia]